MVVSGRRPRELYVLGVLLGIFLLSGIFIASPAQAHELQDPADEGEIVEVNQTGDAVVKTWQGTTYVWQSGEYTVTTSFEPNSSSKHYKICLYEYGDGTKGRELACNGKTVDPNSTSSISVTTSNVETGAETILVELQPTFTSEQVLDKQNITQHTIAKDGDFDDDGLINSREVNDSSLNFTNSDMDGDRIPDGQEVNQYKTDPTNADSDGDGVRDNVEINRGYDPLDPNDPGENGTEKITENLPGAPGTANGLTTGLVALGLLSLGGLCGTVIWKVQQRYRFDPFSNNVGRNSGGEQGGVRAEANQPPPPSTSDSSTADDLLLTDDDRVYNLLRENGGQMKQVNIVEETDWSKSKVSRVLSRMEEDGKINKLRMGRGNTIYLDGAEPDAVKNPHDDID